MIGLIYLAIGLYVLFRRWGAPRATHFYLFCLVSFAFFALKYTDASSTGSDWTVFWMNIAAEALQPALFLHFALSFPEERFKSSPQVPVAPGLCARRGTAGPVALDDRACARQPSPPGPARPDCTAYDAVFYILAALLFLRSYGRAEPLLRQQLKWLTRGTLLAVLPFTLFYAIPVPARPPSPRTADRSGRFLAGFLPLTFSWAIVRYRLMDTDLIFKRGVAYTLATGLILGAYFGMIALIAVMVHNGMPEAVSEWGLVLAILVTAAIFDPLKRRIQGWVDRGLRSPSLRLPQGPGRVRPRPQLRDRSGGSARVDRRAAAANPSGGARCNISRG